EHLVGYLIGVQLARLFVSIAAAVGQPGAVVLPADAPLPAALRLVGRQVAIRDALEDGVDREPAQLRDLCDGVRAVIVLRLASGGLLQRAPQRLARLGASQRLD